jgi:hypothetical protein
MHMYCTNIPIGGACFAIKALHKRELEMKMTAWLKKALPETESVVQNGIFSTTSLGDSNGIQCR